MSVDKVLHIPVVIAHTPNEQVSVITVKPVIFITHRQWNGVVVMTYDSKDNETMTAHN